jgi:hypothetical protein
MELLNGDSTIPAINGDHILVLEIDNENNMIVSYGLTTIGGAPAAFDLLNGNKLSATGNLAGDEIIVHFSTLLDPTYSLHPDDFIVTVNDSVSASIFSIAYDSNDCTHSTIIIKLSGHPQTDSTIVQLAIHQDALKSVDGRFNHSTGSPIGVTLFKSLDLTNDNLIRIDDIVQIATNPSRQIDINHDGEFDSHDIYQLLERVSSKL